MYLLNQYEDITAVLEQGNKNTASFKDAKIKSVLNGETLLTFTAPYDNDQIKTIVNNGYCVIQNKYKKWQLFFITEIDYKHGDTLEIEVTAEASQVELDGVVIENLDLSGQTPAVALPQILLGTRWEVGTITGGVSADDLKIKYKSVLETLQLFKQSAVGELVFHVEISGNAISRRLVDFTATQGVFKGKRFEYSKDLEEIIRTVDTKGIKTALYGLGNTITTQTLKSNTTIKVNVNPNLFTTNQKNPTSTAHLDTFSWAGELTESISTEKPSGLQSDITRSFKITQKNSTSKYSVINTANAKTTCKVSTKYTFSCYVKCNQAKTLSARIEFQKNNTSFTGGSGYTEKKVYVPKNTWQRLSVTTKSPATANQVFGEIRVNDAVIGTTLQWAGAKLEEGDLTALYSHTETTTEDIKSDIPPDLQQPLTFADQVWVSGGEGDYSKPDGQIWLGDETARSLWGVDVDNDGVKEHIFGVFNFSTDDPLELLNETDSELRRLKDPIITYKGKVVDFYRLLGLESENIDLGDLCAVIDNDLGFKLQARLIETVEDLDFPEQGELTLGNFYPTFIGQDTQARVDDLTQRVNAVEGSDFVRKGEAIDPSWLDSEFSFARDELITGGGTVIMNEGDGILIVDDPNDPQKAIKLNAGQIALANTRDLTTGEFNWRNFGTGEGWLSSLIETGHLKFEDAQGGLLTLGGTIVGYNQDIRIVTINWADKLHADGDLTRQIFYTGSYATEQAWNVPTQEVYGGYEGGNAVDDGQTLNFSITNNQKLSFRYVRDWLNGNTVNGNNYWNDIQVWAGATNRALGKLPTSNGVLTNAVNMTDGNASTYGYETAVTGAKWVQVDLGAVYSDIDNVKIFHYYLDGRTFHGTKTEVSTDGVTWLTLYDSAVSGEYVETSSGKTYVQTATGSPVGNKVQFVFKFIVDITELDSLDFTATGIAGQPFTVKMWNMVTGAWGTTYIATYDGINDRQDVVLTIPKADLPIYTDTNGNCYYSIVSTNSLVANSTFTLSVDRTKLDLNYFTETTPIFQNGRMVVLDKDGEIIADLDGQTGGFTNLYVADLDCPNVVEYQYFDNDLNYYVAELKNTAIGVTGEPNDDNDGLTWASPLKSIQEAVDRLPKHFDGNVFINLASGQSFRESFVIAGFCGNGSITVDGINMGTTKVIGNIDVNRNNVATYLKNFTQNATDSYSAMSLNNAHVELTSIKINGVVNNGTLYGFDCLYRAYVKLTSCEVYSCERGIRAGYGGTAHLYSGNKGYGSVSGLYAQSGIIMGTDTAPAGVANSVVTQGGQNFGSFTYNSGSYVVPTPPEQIKTLTATSGANWSSGNGWQTDYVKQGNYGYGNRTGAWFFPSITGAIGTGKTIKKIRIWFSRTSGKGTSAPARHSIRYHKSATRPSGNVSVSPEIASLTLGWGKSGWATVSSSYHSAFANGTAKGISIYTSDGRYYSASPTTTCKIEITYS